MPRYAANPFKKGNPGRPKGAKNKITKAFREAVVEAFNELGGTDGLVQWGRLHRTEFYKICARLIPAEVSVTHAPDLASLVIDRVDSRDDIVDAHDDQSSTVH